MRAHEFIKKQEVDEALPLVGLGARAAGSAIAGVGKPLLDLLTKVGNSIKNPNLSQALATVATSALTKPGQTLPPGGTQSKSQSGNQEISFNVGDQKKVFNPNDPQHMAALEKILKTLPNQ